MQEKARQIVVDYFNAHADKTDNKKITLEDAICDLDANLE